jgi:hypothetical protein
MHPELLQRFCATTNDTRVWLQKPWRDAGHIYATNGHMIVRIPDDGREVSANDKSHTKVPGWFSKHKGCEFIPIPDLLPEPPCEVCDGKGWHDGADCGECEGGKFEHGSHTYDCMHCGATGRIAAESICLTCDGFGTTAHNSRTAIGNTCYQTRYLKFLSTLPGIMISPNGPSDPCAFRFDGGSGLIMPMRGGR